MTDDLSNRVAMLEFTVNGVGGLVETVALIRTDLADLRHQFLEHKEHTAAEFSALRGLGEQLRTEMRGVAEELRTEMRALNDETGRAMRVLHEDLVARIGLLQEGPAPRKRRRS